MGMVGFEPTISHSGGKEFNQTNIHPLPRSETKVC